MYRISCNVNAKIMFVWRYTLYVTCFALSLLRFLMARMLPAPFAELRIDELALDLADVFAGPVIIAFACGALEAY